MKKPPIGIIPKWLWLELLEGDVPSEVEVENRKTALIAAIGRYRDRSMTPLQEWIEELAQY